MVEQRQDNVRPFPAFYFNVKLENDSHVSEIPFKEVSGLVVEEEFPIKQTNLILKRSLTPVKSDLLKKLMGSFCSTPSLYQITICLSDSDGTPLRIWLATDAHVIKLDTPSFWGNDKDEEAELETIEFTYDKLERKQ